MPTLFALVLLLPACVHGFAPPIAQPRWQRAHIGAGVGQRAHIGAGGARTTLVALRGGGGGARVSLWSQYLRLLDEKPMLAKTITSATLGGIGDLIAQVIEGVPALAFRRTIVLMLVNVVYIVPILTAFYAVNERLANTVFGTSKEGSSSVGRTGFQLAFDQLLNAPIVVYGFFWAFAAMNKLVGGSGSVTWSALALATRAETAAKYFPLLINNWKYRMIRAHRARCFACLPLPLCTLLTVALRRVRIVCVAQDLGGATAHQLRVRAAEWTRCIRECCRARVERGAEPGC